MGVQEDVWGHVLGVVMEIVKAVAIILVKALVPQDVARLVEIGANNNYSYEKDIEKRTLC